MRPPEDVGTHLDLISTLGGYCTDCRKSNRSLYWRSNIGSEGDACLSKHEQVKLLWSLVRYDWLSILL